MEPAESDHSSDSSSILSLYYSSSSFEGSEESDSTSEHSDLDQESTVVEPYLYEPEDSDSSLPAEGNSSEHQDEDRLSNGKW